MKKLTIMVSMYQSGEWIENRINNLLASSMIDDMDIWCVNADSPDARDHDIPQKFPVRYVRLPERNTVYETWNYIIENSDSVYITNANTDDLIHPKGYEILTGALDKQGPKCGFAYPSWYTTARANQEWANMKGIDPGGRPGNFAGNVDTAGVGHFPVWRRSLHDKLGLFDPQFKALADADWWCRCWWIEKTQFFWVNQLLACYLWRNGDNLWHREMSSKGGDHSLPSFPRREWAKFHGKVQKYQKGILE